MTGMAPDGGLLIPESIPDVSSHLARWSQLSYLDLAMEVMRLFVDLPAPVFQAMVRRSYATFHHPEIVPVVSVGGVHVLELFHGPTLAFKDVALQLLGNLFEHLLEASGQDLNIVAATSGDTGSAAIHGVKGRARMRIFVMHPHRRVSRTQELQMTSVLDPNVHNLAVQGTFDDCQGILKQLFSDLPFKDQYHLGAVNSINWARVLAQVVYYFHGAFRVQRATGASHVTFSVPTGNFGDIFAGYVACRMGLPVRRLILATNENDILSRFFNTGLYRRGTVHSTLSPSMDIQVASNFERYLYYRLNGDCGKLRALMADFARTGELGVPGPADPLFAAASGSTEGTLSTIREFHSRHGYLLDPHTAVGIDVARRVASGDEPVICLATAHPAKFGEAILRATGSDLAHHPLLDSLEGKPTRCEVVDADEAAVRRFIVSRLPGARPAGEPGRGPG
jgi:threonine synthase